MMVDFDGAFNSKLYDFLRKILYGYNVSPLNSVEKMILENRERVHNVNEFLSNDLIGFLRSARNNVDVRDVVMFLIESEMYGCLEKSVRAISSAVENDVFLTRDQLVDCVADSEGLPVDWYVVTSGSEVNVVDELDSPIFKPSVDLDDMRRRMR